MKKLLLALCVILLPTLALAQSQRNPCFYTDANPSSTSGCIPVSTDNPLPVDATVTATANTVAKATSAAPSYVEGSTDSLSMDLNGGLRITGTINATSAATATAAAPTYVEGTANPFSQNLTGDLRTIAKQNGTWSVNQAGTWNIGNITGTISLPTGAATSALQSTINSTLGSPFQAGGSIGNTAFGISGTLPAFASTPTFNFGTLNGAATAANQATGNTSLSSIDGKTPALGQALAAASVPVILPAATITTLTPPTTITANAGTNLNTSLLALESGGNLASLVTQLGAVTASPTANTVNDRLKTINTTLGTPLQNSGGSVGISGTLPAFAAPPHVVVDSGAVTVSGTVTANFGTLNGAATAAKQPSLGTAGSPSADVISVQGVTSGTALPVSAASLPLPTLAATSTKQSDGSQKTQIVDGSGNVIASTSNALNVAITSGGGSGGTASSFGATFPATGTAIGAKNGANMVNLSADGSSNLNVNCAVGCAGGSTSNASSGVATSSTNGQSVSWLYGFNGTTWDQLQVDGSKNLKVLATGTVAATQSGTWNIGSITTLPALPANQSVNEAQINGVTPLMGNGVTGTGSQRVTIASDNSAVAGMGVGATGSAPPANANYIATRQTGNLTGLITCDSTAIYDASTTGSTQLVALTSGQTIYVCGYDITVGATATNVKLVYGTGTNCVTSPANMTPAFQFATNGGIARGNGIWAGMKTAAANALCVNASAANAVQAIVYYTKF